MSWFRGSIFRNTLRLDSIAILFAIQPLLSQTHAYPIMAAASAAVEGGKADGSNVRLERFSDALEKFLKAIDERAK